LFVCFLDKEKITTEDGTVVNSLTSWWLPSKGQDRVK